MTAAKTKLNILDKKEFTSTEVEQISCLSRAVLDYWEHEFEVFFPENKNGGKIYSNTDVELILKIKQYLTVERVNKTEIIEKLTSNE